QAELSPGQLLRLLNKPPCTKAPRSASSSPRKGTRQARVPKAGQPPAKPSAAAPANAQQKSWKLLRKLRCSPARRPPRQGYRRPTELRGHPRTKRVRTTARTASRVQ